MGRWCRTTYMASTQSCWGEAHTGARPPPPLESRPLAVETVLPMEAMPRSRVRQPAPRTRTEGLTPEAAGPALPEAHGAEEPPTSRTAFMNELQTRIRYLSDEDLERLLDLARRLSR